MKTAEQQAIFAIAITVIASYLYFLVLGWINQVKNTGAANHPVRLYLIRKLSGLLLLGLIPALLYFLFFDLLPFREENSSGNSLSLWALVTGISVFLILLNQINSKSAGLQTVYPEMRIRQWNLVSIAIAGGGWVLYLTGYEYLFRCMLLSGCMNAFGIWPAIAINLALYSTLHLPKGFKEALAAIPFGALLCYLTIESSSILPAIILHSVQAISTEISCIYRNKEMSFSLI
jgi:membrane protease YdiL (CAAX protease family)